MILFFSKSRIDSKETKLYGFMLISSFFDVILVLAELIITYYFLDDVNVYRYAEYLKKFAKETQFLVITHRKGTMEAADTVYGVTMEEKGISKLLSMKLK